MAITDSFNLDQALNSPSYAYKCYHNYRYGDEDGKNTMGISRKEMEQIEERWAHLKGDWDARAARDENKYEISDEDWNSAVDDGKEHASDVSEHDGSTDTARSWGVGISGAVAGGLGGAAAGTAAAITAGSAASAVTSGAATCGTAANLGAVVAAGTAQGASEAAATAATKATAAASKAKLSVWLSLAASVILVAMATWMKAAHFNKDQVEAAQKLHQEQTENSQKTLNKEQNNMANYAAELEEKSAEAEDLNTDTNDEITNKKKDYDVFLDEYMMIMEKLESGEPLTDDDKERLKVLRGYMEELGIDIEDLTTDTQDSTEDIYDEMEGYDEKFDASAETMANVQGVTEFAAQFDEQTVKNCEAVKVSATIGVAGAGITAAGAALGMAKAAGKGIFGIAEWIAGGVALASAGVAGVLLGGVIKEQKQFKNTVKEEIDVRHQTEDLNVATKDQYDERMDDFDGYVGTVEDLEIIEPDNMEVPEEPPETTPEGEGGEGNGAPQNPFAPTSTGQGDGSNPYMPNSGGQGENPYMPGTPTTYGAPNTTPTTPTATSYGAPPANPTTPPLNPTAPPTTPGTNGGINVPTDTTPDNPPKGDEDKDPDKDKDKELEA